MEVCTYIFGGTLIKIGDLQIRVYKNAIFVPKDPKTNFAEDLDWGLYDSDGLLIDTASYTRGLARTRVGQRSRTKHRIDRLRRSPEAAYVYVGPFHFHYGHFLLATLGRLWPYLTDRLQELKLAYHGRDDPRTMVQVPFVREITQALGLRSEHFAHLVEPTCLPEVWVPEPCFDEDQSAHRIYAELGSTVGRRIVEASPPTMPPRSAPAYLSKSRLTKGVWRFRHEELLDHNLRDRGIDIVYPETLNLADQIRVFNEREIVVSNAGSALHTSILSRTPNMIVGLSRSSWVHSSQIVIDILKRNMSLYLDVSRSLKDVGPCDNFSSNLEIMEPSRLADNVLAAVTEIRARGAVPKPENYMQARFQA